MKLPLLFKDNRIQGKTPLRQAQLIELHLLLVVKELCERHNIQFWLCGGTLLGALRHNGFVPWDDDLDIMILKRDYKRFVSVAKEELPEDVYLDLPDTIEAERCENVIARLRDNYSTGIIRHNKRLLINDHHGINIDIFCLEECGCKTRFLTSVLHSYVSNVGWSRRACYDRVTLKNLIKKWGLFVWVGITGSVWRIAQVLCCNKPYFSPTNFYVAWKEWHPKDWFVRPGQKPRMACFEGHEFPIPYNAEEYLSVLYHDWKQFPPMDKRHGYYGLILPFTPCMHPQAMEYPLPSGDVVSCGGTLVKATGE